MRWPWVAIAMAAAACGGGGERHAAKPAPQVASAPAAKPMLFGPTTLGPQVVLERIRSQYLGGMKRCYTQLLKTRATVRGKVMIMFTVDEKGRAQGGDAKGFAGKVDACLEAQMAGWTFPVPKDERGVATEATFALPLELEAD